MIKKEIFIIAVSIITSSIVLIAVQKFGLGLSPDSIAYCATANSLLNGNGFISFDGLPLIDWPPLYPSFLFVFSLILNLNPYSSAVFLNSILFGASIYFSGKILIRLIDDSIAVLMGILLIIISIPLVSIALWTWSEMLFIFFSILYLFFFIRFTDKFKIKYLFLLGAISSLMPAIRYIGIIFIPLTIIIFFYLKPFSWRKNMVLIVSYLVLSLIPFGLMLFRNYSISGSLFGRRGSTKNSILSNIDLSVEKIISWFLPESTVDSGLFFFIAILFFGFIMYRHFISKSKPAHVLEQLKNRVAILIIFILVYLSAVIIVSSFRSIDPIDDRLLSPVYIPLILLFCISTYNFKRRSGSGWYKSAFTFLLFLLLLCKPIITNSTYVARHIKFGSGYSGSNWEKENVKSWISGFLGLKDSINSVYSNDPFAVYYLTGVYSKWSPVKAFGGSDEIHTQLDELNGVWPVEGESYFIWINERKFQQRALYNPAELKAVANIEKVDSSSLGTIYLVSKRNNP